MEPERNRLGRCVMGPMTVGSAHCCTGKNVGLTSYIVGTSDNIAEEFSEHSGGNS